jgi:hypothetical protein
VGLLDKSKLAQAGMKLGFGKLKLTAGTVNKKNWSMWHA